VVPKTKAAKSNHPPQIENLTAFGYALLAVIKEHPGVTGYDINYIIQESISYHLDASLSYIYPTLKKLHLKGLVKFQAIPIENRSPMKKYWLTDPGEQVLQAWLKEPVAESFDFRPFLLKLGFAIFMEKETLLAHLDREIRYREGILSTGAERGINPEMAYLDYPDREKAKFLLQEMYDLVGGLEVEKVRYLKAMRAHVEKDL
jgi:DNA-binding PadR family transcriptional regulator